MDGKTEGEGRVFTSRGEHYIVEASGCNPELLGSIERVQEVMVQSAVEAGVNIWAISFHRFPPSGVSGVVVISESHLSVHTWPELGYAALDIYTCGESDPERAVNYAVERLGAKSAQVTQMTRGLSEVEGGKTYFYHSLRTWEDEPIPEQSATETGVSRPAGRRVKRV